MTIAAVQIDKAAWMDGSGCDCNLLMVCGGAGQSNECAYIYRKTTVGSGLQWRNIQL